MWRTNINFVWIGDFFYTIKYVIAYEKDCFIDVLRRCDVRCG